MMRYVENEYREYVLKQIIITIEGGRIADLDVEKGRIVLEDSGRNVVVCFKVTEYEKEFLETEAEKNNVSISEYIRSKLLS